MRLSLGPYVEHRIDKSSKGDTPTSPSSGTRSNNLGGQGSHFPSKDDDNTYSRGAEPSGSTIPDTNLQAAGPASQTKAIAAGSEHVDTAPEGRVQAYSRDNTPAQPSATSSSAPVQTHLPATVTPSAASHSASNTTAATQDIPSTEDSTKGTGTAAVGQTTTYSFQRLGKGDPVGSIVDRDSNDPLSFSRPETGYGPGLHSGHEHAAATSNRSANENLGQSGVTSSAPLAAASAAWATHTGTILHFPPRSFLPFLSNHGISKQQDARGLSRIRKSLQGYSSS